MTTPRAEAIKYWDDNLAKFLITQPGPTESEIAMYLAGRASRDEEVARLRREKLELQYIPGRGVG